MADPTDFPVIETERLVLRSVVDADAAALFAIHSDVDWMALWGADLPVRIEQTLGVIDAWDAWRTAPNPGVRWGLERRSGGELIGTAGLFRWSREWRSCMTSYELAREFSGHGYMVEAMAAVIDWGWREMELNRVEAMVHPANRASLAMLRRLGFEQEGHLRRAARWGGEFRDLLVLGLLRDD